jgi:hypothetical protein
MKEDPMTTSRDDLEPAFENNRPLADPTLKFAGFEGLRVKLRKAESGSYALGVDIELNVDGEPVGPSDELDALEGDDAPDGVEANLALDGAGAGVDDDEVEEGGDDARSAEDHGDDDEGALAAGEAETPAGDQWPNQLPVEKGILEISQAPALFHDLEEDEATEGGRANGMRLSAAATPSSRAAAAVQRMLAEARKTIGLGERPPGSNHNSITVWYNAHIARIGNGPWCNMAVTYWAGHSQNLPAIFAGRKIGYAYTVAHAQKFKQKKRWHAGVAGIKPGDVVFFDWNGSRLIRNIDHVGLVERVNGKKIVTIEGNTTGDRCRRVVRDAKFIVGYGRPAYT